MYKRKTKDCYAIEGNNGYGWGIECNCEDLKDAKVQLKTYTIMTLTLYVADMLLMQNLLWDYCLLEFQKKFLL